ncbi:guanine deaminase [Parabacteroides bouchesdurhonensis]|uniref:guanine deaminase n=1 Tax=Parabacteroides bouchesdurhonensis TaxID=1936995 RepID=UPI000E4EB1F0|nr:guanine deaminase [Parabacteroides bouchesdurhonensis]RHJ91358.1 guanine deaminase [Bacteroides sp. AM07-16]
MSRVVRLFRGEVFYFISSPLESKDSYCYYPDGALLVSDGKVADSGPYETLHARYPSVPETDYSGKLIMPGFIDSHIHYSQSEIIGMHGCQLLDWLNDYTYPAEEAFSSREHAEKTARFFIHELLKNGTTTCMAYATVHPESVDALFTIASEYDMCMLTGKVLMNRNAPKGLLDSTEKGEADTRRLIEKWHGKGRNRYVITPRFAITCTLDQLESAGRLHAEYPDTYIQTHLSENRDEIDSVLSLYPGHSDYLEVYERTGLMTDRTVFGHCIHLSKEECKRLASAGATIAHCPTSNLFLGSGLFNMSLANTFAIKTTLATDVAGGTSFSMFRTMGEAYKVQQLNGYPVSALELLYKCTLGSAKALHLEDKIGSFTPGSDADFIVVDYASTDSQQLRKEYLQRTNNWNIENKLFGLQILGDDRAITATYLTGKQVL